MSSIVWTSEPVARAVTSHLSLSNPIVVGSPEELVAAPRTARTITFLDDTTIELLDRYAASFVRSGPSAEWRRTIAAVSGPVIVLSESATPQPSVRWLQSQPWLSHVVSASWLASGNSYLADVVRGLESRELPKLLDWIDPSVEGRRIRLTHASRCAARVEKITEFFASKNVAPQVLQQIRVVSRELLVNAFYNAPVEAGALKHRLDETQDLALPDENACDIAYGWRGDHAVLRVLDPFGAMTRARLVESIARFTNGEPQPDPMGMSRTFGVAFLAVAVHQYRTTEFLVGIGAPQRFAFHMFFKDGSKRQFWRLADESTGNPMSSHSITILPSD